MIVRSSSISDDYRAAMEAFLARESEEGLCRAYELGRQAIDSGASILEMAEVHHATMTSIILNAPDPEQRLARAGQVFSELLSPFEMTLRGYRETNAGLAVSNLRLKQQKAELEQSRAATDAANAELESFSYSVAHDLRAPLRHLDGFISLLRRHLEANLSDTARTHMDNIAAVVRRMGKLINDLLEFSRTGRAEMHKLGVALRPMVDEILSALEADLRGRDIEWRLAPLAIVTGDPAMLRVVLTNLIANAVKYTGKRAKAVIEIGAEESPGEIIVFVRDNGVGFDEQYAHKLFRAFERLHAAQDFEGTGIGLASVRRIVQRHGGRAWAKGELDRGATFYFSLPVLEQPA